MTSDPIATFGRAFAIAACLAVAACSAGAGSIQWSLTPSPSAIPLSTAPGSPSEAATPLETATPTMPAASPAASPHPVTSPTVTPVPSPPPTAIKPGDIVETLVGDVRVRSKPRVTDSVKLEPLLPAGTKLYVLDGPVAGSGYAWFWVAQLSSRELPEGWVAAAGRDGEAWLDPSAFDCPALPDDFQSLVSLPPGAGLACFSRVPITFKARLFDCNCDPTPGSDWITPNWLFGGYQKTIMVDPSVASGSDAPVGMAFMLDPKGTDPATVPIGVSREIEGGIVPKVVRITGMFDHPAAKGCRWDSQDPPPAATLPLDPAVGACRLEFAVTRVVVP
jgi:hypothetical protein